MELHGAAVELVHPPQSAQLKVRPGRQAWEGAPDFFKMTAFDADPDTLAARKGSLAGKVAHATKLKERGNEAYTKACVCALSHWDDYPFLHELMPLLRQPLCH
jgi:hypothetical protein